MLLFALVPIHVTTKSEFKEYLTEITTVFSYRHNVALHEIQKRVTAPQLRVMAHQRLTFPLCSSSSSQIRSHPLFHLTALRFTS